MSFEIDTTAFWIGLGVFTFFYLVYLWSKSFPQPQIYVSQIDVMKVKEKSWKESWASLPRILEILALSLFILAFLNPHLFIPREGKPPEPLSPSPTEGIAIYLVLDQSGSMEQEIGTTTKLSLLKQVTQDFVKERKNDLIGLVAFARGAQVLAPLTLDHDMISKKLDSLDIMRLKDQDGTAIGYAIFKTANLISSTREFSRRQSGYEIKNSVMVLVTDGFQDPNPLDENNELRNIELLDAAQYAKDNNIKIYLINVEPQLTTEKFASYRHVMRQVAESTGGKFYMLDSPNDLKKIYAEIDRLEKSTLPEPPKFVLPKDELPEYFRKIVFYPFLIGLGLAFLGLSWILQTTVMRSAP